MKEDSLLRLSIMANSGQAVTFKKNLMKLISISLYDLGNSPMTIDEIRTNIACIYDMEFTNEEIEKVITGKNSGLLCIKEDKYITRGTTKFRESIVKYRIDETAYLKLKNTESQNIFQDIISEFYSIYAPGGYTEESFLSLLYKFLYNVLNTNKNTLIQLFKKQDMLKNIELYDIGEGDKKLINDFLNWDNRKKNEAIFNCISYGLDYCMLTVKKDPASFSQLFRGKIFYLDTNVIFRLAGVNNNERKIVIKSFIDKCINNGIIIKYSNHTYKELTETIKKEVENVKTITGGRRLVSIKHYQNFVKPSTALDFIRMYDEWCKMPGTKYNDYEAFRKYLIKEIDDILRKFKKIDFIDYKIQKSELFNSLFESLKKYKTDRNANWTPLSVSIDVNNYLHVYSLRERSNGINFMDINDYFISTDNNLCEWGKEVLPSTIPVALLPSVWHSILLKFKGRTKEDYKAFCLFLNLRFRINDIGFDERKPEILEKVQNLDEPVDLKDKILQEISCNLSDTYRNLSVPEVVEKAKNTVIERELKRIYEDNGKPLVDKGIAEGKLQMLFYIAERKTESKIKFRDNVVRAMNIGKIIIGVVSLFLLIYTFATWGFSIIYKTLQTDIKGYDVYNWTCIGGMLIGWIIFFISEPIKKLINSKTYEDMKNNEIKKLEKKYKFSLDK